MRWVLAVLLLLTSVVAGAESPIEQAQKAELERVRAKVANQVQLSAYALVDELVYGWRVDPVFDKPTPVVLAGVTVPVGLGTGMQSLVENHLSGVILENPSTRMQLVHCPTCTQVVVHSGPEATVVSRGIDHPSVLEELGAGAGRYALFVDIEAEGSFLVLRARLTRLGQDLTIVWSRTISTDASTPALLRSSSDLKSAADARAEYLAALEDRGNVNAIARLGVRTYAQPLGPTDGLPLPPYYWVQGGAEFSPTAAMDWLAAFTVGGSFVPQSYSGLMAEVRVERLLTGRVRSHTRPDLYFFGGGSVMTVWGPASTPFQKEQATADDVLQASRGTSPRFILGNVTFGFDLRLGNRIGIDAFLETLPTRQNSANIGRHVRVLGINWQSLGLEVSLCF